MPNDATGATEEAGEQFLTRLASLPSSAGVGRGMEAAPSPSLRRRSASCKRRARWRRHPPPWTIRSRP
eukprot:5215266-Pyramimonas_sp.AAC.1